MAMMEALLKIRADVQGEGKIGALGKALGGLNGAAASASAGLKGMVGSVGNVAGAMGALTPLLSAAGLIGMAKASIDAGNQLYDMSQKTGVSVEMLAKLKKAAVGTGTDIEGIGKAMVKLSKSISASLESGISAATAATGGSTARLQNSLAGQVQAYQQHQAQLVAAARAGGERQLQEVQARERQQIEAVRAAQDRALQAVKDGEQRQVDAVERAAEARNRAVEQESDARLREINRRYRQEEKLLNDNYDDARDRAQQAADEELNILERRITRLYDAKRKAIQADNSLGESAKEQMLQNLQDQQDAELKQLRNGYAERAKLRDRQFRDQQERDQQAIEDRKRKEEEAEKARTDAQKRAINERAKVEKDGIAKAAAAREAAIRKDAADQERLIKEGAAAAAKAIKQATDARVKALTDQGAAAKDAFKKLGIELRNQDGTVRSSTAILLDIANKFKAMPDGVEKTALALQLFGKSGADMIPVLNKGGDAIDKLKVKMTEAFAKQADEYDKKLKAISGKIGAIGADIATVLLPALDATAVAVTAVVGVFDMMPGPLKAIIGGLVLLSALFVALAPAIAAVVSIGGALAGLQIGATIAGWAGAIGPAVAGITAALGGILTWIGGTLIPGLLTFFSGPVGWTVLAVAAVVAMAIAFREPLAKFLTWFGDAFMKGLQAFGTLLYDVFVQPWVDLWNNVLKAPVMATLSWLQGMFDWTFKALYEIAWQLFVQPWINLWNNVLREPVIGAITWITEAMTAIGAAMQAGLIALASVAYDVFVQPWVNLWQNVFRQPVIGAIGWLTSTWSNISRGFTANVVQPIVQAWNAMLQLLPQAMGRAVTFVQNAWLGMINTIRNALRGFLVSIANGINSVVRAVNKVIAGFNNLPGPDIPFVSGVSVPAFAEGGYVKQATFGLVGEAGPEYIIPERKMRQASTAYLAGARGGSVLNSSTAQSRSAPARSQNLTRTVPARNQQATRSLSTRNQGQLSTVVAASQQLMQSRTNVRTGAVRPDNRSISINVKTGPVVEFQGERYVKVEDLDRAMRATADGVISRLRTPSARIALGIR